MRISKVFSDMYRVYIKHETYDIRIKEGKADVSELPDEHKEYVTNYIKNRET